MTTDIVVKRPTLWASSWPALDNWTALPAHIPVERFVRVALTAVATSPRLLEMDRASLWNACESGRWPFDGRRARWSRSRARVT